MDAFWQALTAFGAALLGLGTMGVVYLGLKLKTMIQAAMKDSRDAAGDAKIAAVDAKLAAQHAATQATQATVASQRVEKAIIASTDAAQETADKAAVKVDEVAAVNAEQSDMLSNLTKTTDATYKLANSHTRASLKLIADLSRWKANQTRDASDAKEADNAERVLREHDAKQAEADRTGGQK